MENREKVNCKDCINYKTCKSVLKDIDNFTCRSFDRK